MNEEQAFIVRHEDNESRKEALPVDILGREELIAQVLDLLNTLSEVRSSCTFALNGKWGAGKTYIIKKLEQQLQDYEDTGKFVTFHYNCWQYNYYEEPLVAIVAAMQDSLDEQRHLLSPEMRKRMGQALEISLGVMKKLAYSIVRNKIGIDVKEVSDTVKEGADEWQKKQEEQQQYDKYYAFKKTIDEARKQMSEVSSQATVVIVVDELDRCLPNYAIKILERLHHLFAGLDNTIVILTLDGGQLERTVKCIFGEETDSSEYLRKFIDFEIPIDIGSVNSGFFEKYHEYVSLFDPNLLEPWPEISDYVSALFSKMDMRTQEHLIKKIETIHRLVFKDKKKDYSYLCFELLMVVFSHMAPRSNRIPIFFQKHTHDEFILAFAEEALPNKFVAYAKEHWKYQITILREMGATSVYFPDAMDIPRLLICYSEDVYGNGKMCEQSPGLPKWDRSCVQEFREVLRLLKIIR